MYKTRGLSILLFILSIPCVSNAAEIFYVDANSPNDPGTGTFEDPFRRIQDAIDDAGGGDIIEVQPGVYSGNGNCALDANGDPNVWDFHLKSQFGRWKPSIYTDLDPSGDGFINLLDFAAFASFWQKQGSFIPADLNNSGLVDLFDLRLLLDNYLASYLPEDWGSDDVTSSCIDAGDPNSDWSDELWPNGKRINMDAYGGTNQASKNGNPADFNIDGTVNFTDFASLSGKWMNEQECIEDITNNGVVNFSDLAIVSENWLWQEE